MGSKNRFAKGLLDIILKNRQENQWYVEPFVGGCNIIDKVSGNRIGNDIHFYLISMWTALQNGWTPPKEISKEEYNKIRENKDNFAPELVGYVGFNCSYSGKWFGGYAGKTKTKVGTIRDYQLEAFNNITEQIKNINGIKFYNKNYFELEIPPNSIIYCDIPYQGTTKYKDDFDYVKFWEWCRTMSISGHNVYTSEYNAPDDFECIWQKEATSSLSANGKIGGNKISIEKLFIYKNEQPFKI